MWQEQLSATEMLKKSSKSQSPIILVVTFDPFTTVNVIITILNNLGGETLHCLDAAAAHSGHALIQPRSVINSIRRVNIKSLSCCGKL